MRGRKKCDAEIITRTKRYLRGNDFELLSDSTVILRRKKDGDWYIYPQFLAHENLNNVHYKVQKSYKIFKPTIHNVLSIGTNIVKKLALRVSYTLC